jgi:phage shock protein A
MKSTKNIYTLTEIRENEKKFNCEFCQGGNKSIKALKTRQIATNRLLSTGLICSECIEKYENSELKQCSKCERILEYWEKEKSCVCKHEREKYGEVELNKVLPETYSTQLEKQIHELSLEKEQLREDVEIAISAMGPAKSYEAQRANKLLEENEKLKKQVQELEAENRELKQKLVAVPYYEMNRVGDNIQIDPNSVKLAIANEEISESVISIISKIKNNSQFASNFFSEVERAIDLQNEDSGVKIKISESVVDKLKKEVEKTKEDEEQTAKIEIPPKK